MKFLWTTIMVRDMEASLEFYGGILGLTTRSRFQAGPFQPNPHTKFFYVLDPNGVKIQFVEHM